MKSTSQLLNDYADKIISGKTLNRFESIRGAIELEARSTLNYRDSTAQVATLSNGSASCGTDPSVHTNSDYPFTNEMRVKFDMQNIETALLVANEMNRYTETDSSCGLHIHIKASSLVGFSLETTNGVRRLQRILTCLASASKRYELAFYGLSGQRNRVNNSTYSRPLELSTFEQLKSMNPSRLSNLAIGRRTSFLNLTNLSNYDYSPNERTIEFRGFSASPSLNGENTPNVIRAKHVESALFLILNLLSTAMSETSDLNKLRTARKHPLASKSFQWFLHHSCKRPLVKRWENKDLVLQMISYIMQNCQACDAI
mgnify:CR=1 FL=1